MKNGTNSDVIQVVKALGQVASKGSDEIVLAYFHKKAAELQLTFNQESETLMKYIRAARRDLGYNKKEFEVTPTSLMDMKKLIFDLKINPGKMLVVIEMMRQIGDLDANEKTCKFLKSIMEV